MTSVKSVFHTHSHEMEQENNSIMEVKEITKSIYTILFEHRCNNMSSIPLKLSDYWHRRTW